MMNIRVIQPPYPKCAEDTPASVAFMIDQLRRCDDSLDLILLPECCNAPSGCGDSSLLRALVAEHTQPLLDAVQETALRCGATVGINLYVPGDGCGSELVRNTTLLYNSQGQVAGRYDKQQLPISEYTNDYIDHAYLTSDRNPYCVEADGIRYAFLTCYDMYYTEYIHRVALEKPDVVLICSLQRAERPDILEMQGKNTAFVCNSYVVRSSFHMGPGAVTGACSMVVAPDGKVLHNFGQGKGCFDVQVEDVHWKYSRSNGFGQPPVTNDVYQTLFRAPWCYRVGGSGVREENSRLEFPRLSACRGVPKAAPENTIPSVAIPVAMGADEVAVDVCASADGVPVVSRDACVREMTWEQLRQEDPGKAFGPQYDGVGYAAVEDLFAKFPRRTIWDLHIPAMPEQDAHCLIRSIRLLAERYDCPGHFYISSEDVSVLAAAAEAAPATERCLIGSDVEQACALGCGRIQISDRDPAALLQKAKAAGLRCNVLLTDSQPESWFRLGADCVLTDDFLAAAKMK